MHNPDKTMPFLAHLAEFRRRALLVIGVVLIGSLGLYYLSPQIIDFLVSPIAEYLPQDGRLTVLSALGGFSIRLRVSIFSSIILLSPFISYQILAFVLPALSPSEKRYVVPTVLVMFMLFVIGLAFCFFVVQKTAFGWLVSQSSEFAHVLPNAEDYIRTILLLEVGFGFAFELPVIIFYLVLFHFIPYTKLKSRWRTVYVVLLVLCAIVTPDASPYTMLVMFVVLILLYELALVFARFVIIAKNGKNSLSWDRVQYTNEQLNQ